MAGAIWAQYAWGALLGVGPEGDLGVRLVGGLRGLPACPGDSRWKGQVGVRSSRWSATRTMLFNFIGVNLLLTGFHSYAGL